MGEVEESSHIRRMVRALELLAEAPRSQVELARALDAHPRTVQRLLGGLIAEGYVTRTDTQRREYAATPKIVALAGRVMEQSNLVQTALPLIARLSKLTGETSHLAVPGKAGAIPIVEETSDRIVTVRSRLGGSLPYHATAPGKALLAHLPKHLERTLSAGLERYTEPTVVDTADLLVELAMIRERGYATEDLEYSIELRGVAAPVLDVSGEAVAAVSIQAPAYRLTTNGSTATVEAVVEVARRVTEALCFATPLRGAARLPSGPPDEDRTQPPDWSSAEPVEPATKS
jgi:DNA-binding IclR family transcriptional regulator